MKASGIIALSLATLAVAAPAPHRQAKRDLVWVTETSEVVETVVATTTIYVDAEDVTTTVDAPHYTPTAVPTTVEEAATTEAPATSEQPATSEKPATTAVPTTTEEAPAPEPTTESSSSSEYVVPEPTTSETLSSTYVAPTSTYVAPTSETYVAPSSTYVAPSSTYVAPSSTSAAPAETSAASDLVAAESSSGEIFSPSRITYYSPSVGTSFCGPTYSDDSNVVALSSGSMTLDLCNKQITIEVNGNQFPAFIGEKCPGCSNDGSLDITPTLFTKMMGSTDAGVITNAKWWYN